jgi:hypothetical protein
MTKTSKLSIQDNDASVQGLSPSGRKFDLCSKEDADEFVDILGTDFISTNLTATDDQELILAYEMMTAVAKHASTEKIASGIPESELRTFIEHARGTLDTLSTDRNWLRSGTLSMCHERLLHAIDMLRKPSFIPQDLYFQ